jgi:hypothetical protein
MKGGQAKSKQGDDLIKEGDKWCAPLPPPKRVARNRRLAALPHIVDVLWS